MTADLYGMSACVRLCDAVHSDQQFGLQHATVVHVHVSALGLWFHLDLSTDVLLCLKSQESPVLHESVSGSTNENPCLMRVSQTDNAENQLSQRRETG